MKFISKRLKAGVFTPALQIFISRDLHTTQRMFRQTLDYLV
jgi:hypothetical protein